MTGASAAGAGVARHRQLYSPVAVLDDDPEGPTRRLDRRQQHPVTRLRRTPLFFNADLRTTPRDYHNDHPYTLSTISIYHYFFVSLQPTNIHVSLTTIEHTRTLSVFTAY